MPSCILIYVVRVQRMLWMRRYRLRGIRFPQQCSIRSERVNSPYDTSALKASFPCPCHLSFFFFFFLFSTHGVTYILCELSTHLYIPCIPLPLRPSGGKHRPVTLMLRRQGASAEGRKEGKRHERKNRSGRCDRIKVAVGSSRVGHPSVCFHANLSRREI